jgi:hypothetical protein
MMRVIPATALMALTACTAIPAVPAGPLIGNWGGQHIGLQLSGSGGTVDYDCAAGRIDGPVVPDGSGRFRAVGVHTPAMGGPERVGEQRPSYSASYSGQVSGDWMTLRVDVPSQRIVIGPYRLQRNAQPMLMRCL